MISPLKQISRTTPLIWHLLFESQQWKRQNNVRNMLKSTMIKTPERGQSRHSSFFVVNFEHIWYIILVSPLLHLNK